jgi:deoxyribodipyrimidine photolyase
LVKRIQGFWTHSILEPDSIPGGLNQLPAVFTPFRHKIERENLRFELPPLRVEPNVVSPTSSSQAFPFEPGEASALARLGAYMNNPEGAAEYKTRRNGLLGTEYSTKFSPWLASGALSPRRIWQACLNLEESLGGSPEVEWIRVELLSPTALAADFLAKRDSVSRHPEPDSTPEPSNGGSRDKPATISSTRACENSQKRDTAATALGKI